MTKFFKQHKLLVIVLPLVLILCAAVIVGVIYVDRMRQARAYVEEGDRYLADLNYEQAIICYQQAINIDEKNRGANLGMAECYEVGGQNVYAESIYRAMLERDPRDEDVYPKLAELLLRTDKPEEAKALMAQAADYIKGDETIDGWYAMTHPTAPQADQTPGSYDDRIQVALSADVGDIIYYTTDGSEPTENANLYTSPLVMRNGTNTLRAIAVNTAGFTSTVTEVVYTINIADVEIQVQDPVIETAIREELGIGYGQPIYNDDIAQVTELYIIGAYAYYGMTPPDSVTYYEDGSTFSVTKDHSVYTYDAASQLGTLNTLADLQYMPFLHTLNVYGQPQLDISGIVHAPTLTEVSLLNCGLTTADLAPLTQLPQLQTLSLGWNDIDLLDPLASLTGVQSLSLWGNRIGDLSPLGNMTALTLLDISDNNVTDIAPLSGLTALRELWMYNNQISVLAPVQKLEHLQVLMVRNNPISDPESVRAVYPHLTRIDTDLLGLGTHE